MDETTAARIAVRLANATCQHVMTLADGLAMIRHVHGHSRRPKQATQGRMTRWTNPPPVSPSASTKT